MISFTITLNLNPNLDLTPESYLPSHPNNPKQFFPLGRGSQILIPILGNTYTILDPHTADGIIPFENVQVHIVATQPHGSLVAPEVLLDIRPAEIDARFHRHDHVRLEPAVEGEEIGAGDGVFFRVHEHAPQAEHADVSALLPTAVADETHEVLALNAVEEKVRRMVPFVS